MAAAKSKTEAKEPETAVSNEGTILTMPLEYRERSEPNDIFLDASKNAKEFLKELKHFSVLNSMDVKDKTEKKKVGNTELTYLSWAWAWEYVKRKFPDANYVIKKFGENSLPYIYDPLTGYMVFTEMTIEGITHEMWLPVMDGANKAMKAEPYKYYVKNWKNPSSPIEKTCEAADMFDINKTLMRCLVKNIAMFGLGLYIFAGEDLPTPPEEPVAEASKSTATVEQRQQEKKEEAKANDNPELTKLRESIAKELMRISKNMSPAEKIEFADSTIKPIVGTAYYMNCEDIEALEKLSKKLKEIK